MRLAIIRRKKTEEEEKLELLSKLATEQLKKVIKIGTGFPVIAYRI